MGTSDSTKGPWELISKAEENDKGIGAIVFATLGGIIYGFGQGILEMMQAGFALFVDPLNALISGSVNLVDAIWGGWVEILNQGAETAVMALAPGSQWAIGPFTQALSMLSVFLGLYLLARFIASPWSSNLVPGTLVDNRFIDWISTTPEEEEDEND